MNKSVNLFLASGVRDGCGFWLVNFTEEDNIIKSLDSTLLECYRKELFGLNAAIEVKQAINTTLDILSSELKVESYKFDEFTNSYSYEIPLNTIEDIFDLWANNYTNQILWKKYIGLLNFRKKIKRNCNYIKNGLKGQTYEFALKLDELLTTRQDEFSFRSYRSKELMW